MTNEPTIEAMNKAIAEFMQLETDDESYLTPSRTRTVYLINGIWIPLRKLKYHSSWDALMPCWKKVTDVVAEISEDGIYPNDFSTIMDMYAYHCEKVELGAAHNYVYQAIQWYNKQSTTTNEQIT